MNIHILPPLRQDTALGTIIREHIKESGQTESDTVETASFVVGLIESPWPASVSGDRRLILKDPAKVETVPNRAILFNVFTLTRIEGSSREMLCDFLDRASLENRGFESDNAARRIPLSPAEA